MDYSRFRSGMMVGSLVGAAVAVGMMSISRRNRRHSVPVVVSRASEMARDVGRGMNERWAE